MNEQEVKTRARERMKGYCRVCPKCDGKACAGEVPGMGGVLTGTAFVNNIEALAMYNLNMRTIHQVDDPDTSLKVFGRKFATPIFAAPLCGTARNMGGVLQETELASYLVNGAKAAGSCAFTGDGPENEIFAAGLEAITAADGMGIVIIKPLSMEAIKEHLRLAEKSGAMAVGIDIDGAGFSSMASAGNPVSPKTFYQLRELIKNTTLPFIIKGIMTKQEAEMAVEAGAAAIVISNHGGRVLDCTPGVAEVLPEIVERVKGEIFVFADGGVRSGVDVLKMMALGADGVLVGRPLLHGAFGAGSKGVKIILEKITSEFKHAMLMTGCVNVKAIDYKVIY